MAITWPVPDMSFGINKRSLGLISVPRRLHPIAPQDVCHYRQGRCNSADDNITLPAGHLAGAALLAGAQGQETAA